MSSGSQSSSISYFSAAPGVRASAASSVPARRVCRCGARRNNSGESAEREKVSPEQFAALAEAELSAFHRAISEQFGSAFAQAAAEHWLRSFAGLQIDHEDPRRSLRRVTINAIAGAVADRTASNAAFEAK